MRTRRAALALAAMFFGWASPAVAGRVVLDVAERQVLEAADADTVIAPGRVADLLLVVALRERLAALGKVLLDARIIPVVAGTEMKNAFKGALDRAEISRRRLHDLRTSFAT